MAATVPASLKSADIVRFAHRAAQLEKPKPVVAYWCNYWIVNQILSKGLHNADAEALTYTTNLMDRLEQTKQDNATNDAIVDDMAGKAYVEQFAVETFERADNAVKANKASRQTADTYQAAATFLELLAVWETPETEVAAKIKYAKFHALRIAKAIKIGEDPNLSNPKPQTHTEEALPELNPEDAEAQALVGSAATPRPPSVSEAHDEADTQQARLARTSSLDQLLHPSRDPSVIRQQRQPSVAEVPDEELALSSQLAKTSSLDESLHPSRAPSIPRRGADGVSPLAPHGVASYYTANAQPDISPVDTSPEGRKPSTGGNYFPITPAGPAGVPSAPTSFLPDPPSSFAAAPTAPPELSIPPPAISPKPPHNPSNISQQPTQPPYSQTSASPAPQSYGPPPRRLTPSQPPQPLQNTYAAPPPPSQATNVVVDEEAVLKAQKHARWAISALNFEDIPTAIKELEGALRTLGAR